MMTDIRNLQAFALYMQKTDIKFDLYSVTKEMEKQVWPISLINDFHKLQTEIFLCKYILVFCSL